MKLSITQRCEQGTPRGVMIFRPGDYSVKGNDTDGYTVTHEPRTEMKRQPTKDGKAQERVPVQVSKTVVSRAIIDQMVKVGVAKFTE